MGKTIKIPNARRKMGEAQFFFEHLRKEAAGDRSEKLEAFGYYLSAFLGAADSVIDAACREMKIKKTKFKAWKSSLDEQQQHLLCFMIGQRNQEVHHQGAKVVPKQSHVARTFYPHVQPLSLRVMLQGSVEEGPGWIRVWIPKTEYRFVKGQAQTEPVLAECTRYLAVLEKFLAWVEETT